MSFILILDVALGIVLIGFNGWNWFLALTGYSTIEYWGSSTRVIKILNLTILIRLVIKSTILTLNQSEIIFIKPLAPIPS